ncbi:MAG: peptidase M50 [Pseudomonadota bacterium]
MADYFSPHWYRVAELQPLLNAGVRVARHRYRGESWYVLLDAATGKSHRVTPQTYSLIAQMDGRRSLGAIWTEALERLADDAPTQDELIQLLGQLHAADILQFDVSPDSAELFDRHVRTEGNRIVSRFRSPLALRLPLWDPDRFLARTLPWLRPLFGKPGLALWAALVLPALVLAAMHWNDLTHNLTDRVLAGSNLVLLWFTFPVVKVLHELGHAYATKVRGGAVHEIGVMFIVFAPVPYVDSSRANGLRSKWQRAGVGAAGMLVETALAAVALFLWLAVEPGTVRAVCFNVMMIAGVSTLVFNLNPLLRFDGYYILCDLIEMPNLATRSQRFVVDAIDRRAFRAHPAQPQRVLPGERPWLALYAPVSALYRLFVMISIAIFAATKFFFIGVALAVWTVLQGVAWPIAKGFWHVAGSATLERRRVAAVGLVALAACALLVLMFVVPAPYRAVAEGVVWVPEDAQLRVQSAGFVQVVRAAPGARIDSGSIVAQLVDPALDAQLAVQEAKVDELEARLGSERFTDQVKAQLSRQALDAEQAALGRLVDEAGQQTLRARADGWLTLPRAGDLEGRYLHKGDLVGYVSDGEQRLVRLVVGQEDIDALRLSLVSLSVRLAARPDEVHAARLVREVPAGRDELPSRALTLEGGGTNPVDPRDKQGARALNRVFQFDLELHDRVAAPLGSRAYVRLEFSPLPLGLQAWRRVRQLFLTRFDV